MSRLLFSIFALGLSGIAQDIPVNEERLERIRKMSASERERLLEVVRKIKKLPEGERDRLKENLQKFHQLPKEEQKRIRAKAGRLSPKERFLYNKLASQFSGNMSAEERQKMRGFPRMLFFSWLRNERSADFDRLKELGANERGEVFKALLSHFTEAVKFRMHRHFRKHRCVSQNEAGSFENGDGSLNWMKWQRFSRECRFKRKSDMRRKPPRWQ